MQIRAGERRSQFQKNYLRTDGSLGVDTQTAYVLALWVGLVPEGAVKSCADLLASKIEKNGFRMATGFLGTKPLLPVLTATGHHDLAVRLFQSRQYPSWGYEVEQEATSVWERWDSFTKEHGFDGEDGKQNSSMNSFSHYSFGAVAEWMFRSLAGIDSDGPSFGKIIVKPGLPTVSAPALDWVKAEYTHARGKISAASRRRDGTYELDLTIPANTVASVYLPAKDAANIRESGHAVAEADGVKFQRMEGDRTVCEVGSGTYHFTTALR